VYPSNLTRRFPRVHQINRTLTNGPQEHVILRLSSSLTGTTTSLQVARSQIPDAVAQIAGTDDVTDDVTDNAQLSDARNERDQQAYRPRSVSVQVSEDGAPLAFTWRGVMYRVRVIGHWRLSTRWWEPAAAVERPYFRVITADQQIFELYYEAAPTARIPENKRWILDICQG
jgi:uncharacterized protein DUF6504